MIFDIYDIYKLDGKTVKHLSFSIESDSIVNAYKEAKDQVAGQWRHVNRKILMKLRDNRIIAFWIKK